MRFVPAAHTGVVIPVHNRLSSTRKLLSELRAAEHDEALVVVVDDGSTDGTTSYLRKHDADVVVLPGTGQLWWSGGANVGCRFAIEAGAEVLLLLNNDNVHISPNCVSELATCATTYGGCASPVVLNEGTGRIRHAGGTMSWPLRGIELREAGASYHPGLQRVECDWLPGNALAFSALLFTELGGFDEKTFPQYRGDTDFTLRARAHGRPCIVSYSCWVSNDEKKSGLNFYSRVSPKSFLLGLFSLKSSYQLRGTWRFARRYCPPWLIPAYLTLFYLRYAYAVLKTWLPAKFRMAAPR
jgi:GT2 family glycosyltransferase